MKKKLFCLLVSVFLVESCISDTRPDADYSIPIGSIMACALEAKNIPPGWLLCDGSPIPENKYNQLRNILGSNNLPNLSGYTLVGAGVPAYDSTLLFVPLSFGGEYRHTLTADEMPRHKHTIRLSSATSFGVGKNQVPFSGGKASMTTEDAGGGKPHNNMQPYYVINYIIYAGNE